MLWFPLKNGLDLFDSGWWNVVVSTKEWPGFV